MQYILEESTNNHTLEAEHIELIEIDGTSVELEFKGKATVLHGEHGVLFLESKRIKKYVQQEYNPISQRYENAYD